MTKGRSLDMASHLPRMRRVALRFLGDPDEADEVVQEACLKAIRSRASFNGKSNIATWIHSIVTRCALDQLRIRRRQAHYLISSGNGQLAELQGKKPEGPVEQAQLKELRSSIHSAISNLPDDCRDAFMLTQLDGYTYDEAASIEGQPRGTIASRVFRAKQLLTTQLYKELDREVTDDS
ncbi:MAG: hypothetical protein DHS20C16_12760 [Phycisphaerae bacterium]|nr:MAG: hypothetical protein DHS20C16_12760 [Phycisphaerae bacterium]